MRQKLTVGNHDSFEMNHPCPSAALTKVMNLSANLLEGRSAMSLARTYSLSAADRATLRTTLAGYGRRWRTLNYGAFMTHE